MGSPGRLARSGHRALACALSPGRVPQPLALSEEASDRLRTSQKWRSLTFTMSRAREGGLKVPPTLEGQGPHRAGGGGRVTANECHGTCGSTSPSAPGGAGRRADFRSPGVPLAGGCPSDAGVGDPLSSQARFLPRGGGRCALTHGLIPRRDTCREAAAGDRAPGCCWLSASSAASPPTSSSRTLSLRSPGKPGCICRPANGRSAPTAPSLCHHPPGIGVHSHGRRGTRGGHARRGTRRGHGRRGT